MSHRYSFTIAFALAILLIAQFQGQCQAQSAYGQLQNIAGPAPDVPVPTSICAYCKRPEGHSPGCPYYNGGGGSGGGDSEDTPEVDITHAPIITAPVGIACGIIGNAGWYFKEMFGGYPDQSFLSSYHEFNSLDSNDPLFDKPMSFGMHVGGLPWLALYLPTYPIKKGVVGIGKALTPSPKPPKPADPRIAVYEAIADSYDQNRKIAQAEVDKCQADRDAAEWRRLAFLDNFIADRAELRALRDSQSVAAAHDKAEKMLDAWSKSRAEKAKLQASMSAALREKDAFCRAAIDKASATSFLADTHLALKMESVFNELAKGSLPPSVKNAFEREVDTLTILSNGKTALDMGTNLKEIWDSHRAAQSQGKDVLEWLDERETSESMLRMNLKLLPMLSKNPTTGLATGAAETFMDGAYAITACVAYHDQMESERAALEKLRTSRVFEDAIADDWDRMNIVVDAANQREIAARNRLARYDNLKKEYSTYADEVRRGKR